MGLELEGRGVPAQRAARQARERADWVADLRDSLVAHPHRRPERLAARAKEQREHVVARLVARSADAIVAVADAIAEEARGFSPRGPVVTIANGCDFDDFAGLEHRPSDRFRIHAGSFFGKRSPGRSSPRSPARASSSPTGSSSSPSRRGGGRSSCSATRRPCCS